jgi:transcriptional regulator with XRE-family HTH domain
MVNQQKNEDIGDRIRKAREARGLSQLELAQATGFQSATAISLIESGERKVASGLLEKLAQVLHLDVTYLLLGREETPVDVQVALRADKDLTTEDKDAISRFIELAKSKKHGR